MSHESFFNLERFYRGLDKVWSVSDGKVDSHPSSLVPYCDNGDSELLIGHIEYLPDTVCP